jgi:uncharacterized protein YcfJ
MSYERAVIRAKLRQYKQAMDATQVVGAGAGALGGLALGNLLGKGVGELVGSDAPAAAGSIVGTVGGGVAGALLAPKLLEYLKRKTSKTAHTKVALEKLAGYRRGPHISGEEAFQKLCRIAKAKACS